MIVGHFRCRYPNGTWAIIDVKRGFGVYYENYRTHFVTVPDPSYISAHAPPDEFTRMWKSYYDTMAIKERLNPRLLRRCLPVRYWKHLPERSLSSFSAKTAGNVLPSQLPSEVAKSNASASIRLKWPGLGLVAHILLEKSMVERWIFYICKKILALKKTFSCIFIMD